MNGSVNYEDKPTWKTVWMTNNPPHIGISSGEPAGIGPDLCLLLAHQQFGASHPAQPQFRVWGNPILMEQRARTLNIPNPFIHPKSHWHLKPVPLTTSIQPGHPNPKASPYVLQQIDELIQWVQASDNRALVTNPVDKGIINSGGIPFTGHTEYLALKTHTSKVVMMLTGEGLRVALATTHIPLALVPSAITTEHLIHSMHIIHQALQSQFGLPNPKIAVAGLNPHAGENGHLGSEEQTIIQPAIAAAQQAGINAFGPFPADTLFIPTIRAQYDVILAMYHDQGLTALKMLAFETGINITLGLPFIRTSVDHGTAYALAGSGQIQTGSLKAALTLAIDLILKKNHAKTSDS